MASLLPAKYVDTSRLYLGPPKTLHMWNGIIEIFCKTAELPLTNPATHTHHHVLFDLVRGDHKPILRLQDILRMNLVTINLDNFKRVLAISTQPKQATKEITKQYESVFADRIGTLEGRVHLSLDETVLSVVLPARNVPVSLRACAKRELNRMPHLGVILFIDEHTDWASQIVVVDRKSDNHVRMCIDPKYLNNALLHEHHYLPTLEILPKLGNAN